MTLRNGKKESELEGLEGTVPVFLTEPKMPLEDHFRSSHCIKCVEGQNFDVTRSSSSCMRVSKTITDDTLRGQKSRNAFHKASQKSFKTQGRGV